MKRIPKEARQRILQEIIRSGAVRTQEELTARLEQRGVIATQATVSRDLMELGVARVPTASGAVYTLPGRTDETRAAEAARRRLPSILATVAGQTGWASALLVFRTSPGLANMVAATLDACDYSQIVGTVAGDDTIFIALRSPDDRTIVEDILRGMGPGAEPAHG